MSYVCDAVSDDATWSDVTETHTAAEALRQSPEGPCPRILVVGPPRSGRTTTAITLANYAIRARNLSPGWTGGPAVAFADFSLSTPALAMPGTIALAALSTPIQPDVPFLTASPLYYPVGALAPRDAPDVFDVASRCIALAANALLAPGSSTEGLARGGLVIDGPADAESAAALVPLLGVTHVVVLGDDYYVDRIRSAANASETPQSREARVLLARSAPFSLRRLRVPAGAVSSRTAEPSDNVAAEGARRERIRRYFDGVSHRSPSLRGALRLAPRTVPLPPRTIVVGIGRGLTGGGGDSFEMGDGRSELPCVRRELDLECAHQLLAVSHARDITNAATEPLCGFIHVREVHDDGAVRTVRVRAPCQPWPHEGFLCVLLRGVTLIE